MRAAVRHQAGGLGARTCRHSHSDKRGSGEDSPHKVERNRLAEALQVCKAFPLLPVLPIECAVGGIGSAVVDRRPGFWLISL